MAEENRDMGYERLGEAKLSLVDVVAQYVGFMGPVFSAAFLIPLIVGIISATGKGAGIAAPLSVLIAAIGVFAIGWIVAQYAMRIHAALDRLPAEQREVLVLRFLEELSYEEIGLVVGAPLGTVRSRPRAAQTASPRAPRAHRRDA